MKRTLRLYPEWWTVSLSALAWVWIVVQAWSPNGSHRHDHAAMLAQAHGACLPFWTGLWHWFVMVAAMMLPFVTGTVHLTAARSMWARRHRAIAGFLSGYLSLWSLAGAIALVVLAGLQRSYRLSPALAGAAGFGMAALWQVTRAKRRALVSCHRSVPLAPRGWRADGDCFRYGWTIGSSCLTNCWALMLACALAGHSLPAMLCGGAVGFAERSAPQLDNRTIFAAISVVALTFALAGAG